MSIDPVEMTKVVAKKKIIIIAALIPVVFAVVFLGGLSIWISTHRDELRRRQMYVQVGTAVVQHWTTLSDNTRKEIADVCNPILGQLESQTKAEQN